MSEITSNLPSPEAPHEPPFAAEVVEHLSSSDNIADIQTDIVQGDALIPKLTYPHEAFDSIAGLSTRREWIEVAKIIGQHVPIVMKSRRAPTALRQSLTFRFLNGDTGAEVLPQKRFFGDLVNELGYRAPRSVYVANGSSVENIEEVVTKQLDDQKSYFIKPVNGVQGRGTGSFHDIHELAAAVSSSSEDYLVQSDETPQEDWRYILHRDANNTDNVWRIAYRKVRPQVIGDGTSSIGNLVESATDIPEDRKEKIIHKIGERAHRVPQDGQITSVAESGNISNGAYGQLPDQDELHRIDGFMQRFVSDLENHLGSKLNTMCFDLGVKDKSIFEGEYDFEKMKEEVVFYEFQIPFGITGYLDELYSREGRPIERLKNLVKRTRLQIKLAKSALKNLISV